MAYKGVAKSLPEIARELNVDAILEGTVRQSGHSVRITAQLIRAYDDRHLWSERYERDLANVLALQSEVARDVAQQIQINLTPQEQATLTRTRSIDPDAHEALLKGNYFLYRGIPGVAKSAESFRRAIQLDALHSEAYSGLAEALCLVGIFGLLAPAEITPKPRCLR